MYLCFPDVFRVGRTVSVLNYLMNYFRIFECSIFIYIIIIIIKEQPQQAALKGTISLWVQEKRKDMKTQKSKNKEKVVGFNSASLFLARKLEVVTQSGARGIDHLMWRETQGAGIHGYIPDIFI